MTTAWRARVVLRRATLGVAVFALALALFVASAVQGRSYGFCAAMARVMPRCCCHAPLAAAEPTHDRVERSCCCIQHRVDRLPLSDAPALVAVVHAALPPTVVRFDPPRMEALDSAPRSVQTRARDGPPLYRRIGVYLL